MNGLFLRVTALFIDNAMSKSLKMESNKNFSLMSRGKPVIIHSHVVAAHYRTGAMTGSQAMCILPSRCRANAPAPMERIPLYLLSRVHIAAARMRIGTRKAGETQRISEIIRLIPPSNKKAQPINDCAQKANMFISSVRKEKPEMVWRVSVRKSPHSAAFFVSAS